MGSIASVLQWHCERCTLINPTERTRCIRCGTQREKQCSDVLDTAARTRDGQVKSTVEENQNSDSTSANPGFKDLRTSSRTSERHFSTCEMKRDEML